MKKSYNVVKVSQLLKFLSNANQDAPVYLIVDNEPGAVIWEMWNTDLAPMISIRTGIPIAQDHVEPWDDEGPGAA